MRTKTLLLTAALSAAGIATSMAQVYSQNAVGYINLSLPVGFSMIVNQLIVPDYSLNALMPVGANTPPGTQIFKPKAGGGFNLSTKDEFGGGDWQPNGTNTMSPGVGVWINTPTAFTLTFVGEVPQGPALTTPTPTGFNMVGSQVPQAGLVSTALGLVGGPGDQIFKYQGAGLPFLLFQVDDFPPFAWLPTEPSLAVGQAVWLLRAPGSPPAWTRAFTVN